MRTGTFDEMVLLQKRGVPEGADACLVRINSRTGLVKKMIRTGDRGRLGERIHHVWGSCIIKTFLVSRSITIESVFFFSPKQYPTTAYFVSGVPGQEQAYQYYCWAGNWVRRSLTELSDGGLGPLRHGDVRKGSVLRLPRLVVEAGISRRVCPTFAMKQHWILVRASMILIYDGWKHNIYTYPAEIIDGQNEESCSACIS
jgi:hypothetical protein